MYVDLYEINEKNEMTIYKIMLPLKEIIRYNKIGKTLPITPAEELSEEVIDFILTMKNKYCIGKLKQE